MILKKPTGNVWILLRGKTGSRTENTGNSFIDDQTYLDNRNTSLRIRTQ
jgi:hypothetical protein